MRRVAKKWIRNPSDELAIKEGCWFDPKAADRVCRFIETFCVLSKGRWGGTRFKLQAWQRDLLSRLYGWMRADGSRRFRRAYISVSKKNGKSSLLSSLCLYHAVADGENGAEVYCCACDQNQARIVWEEARNMVEASPLLKARLTPVPSTKRIVYEAQRAFIWAVSSISASREGINSSLCVFDELHRQPNDELFRSVEYAGAARRQPLLVMITTAGVDKLSICHQQYRYAKRVESGEIPDTSFFSCIYEADPTDDVDDPATWRKANPSLGVTISEEDFRQELQAAKESYSGFNDFLRRRLNIWTDAFSAWIPDDKIRVCQQPIEEKQLEGKECWAGLDLSATTDTTSLVLVFPDGDSVRLLTRIWLPGENASQCETRDRAPYREWASKGWLTLTEENAIDYEAIRRTVCELGKRFRIKQIAVDDWNAVQIAQQLSQDGFDVVSFGQGYKFLNAPTKELERLILSGKLSFASPVFRWMLGNVALQSDGHENYRPSKQKSTSRIDAVVACCMALGIAPVLRPVERRANPYETASLFA